MVRELVSCPCSLWDQALPQDAGLRLILDNQANAFCDSLLWANWVLLLFCFMCCGGCGIQLPQHSGMVNILESTLAVVFPLIRHTKESFVYFGERIVLLF